MTATEEARAVPRDILAPAKAALGGERCSVVAGMVGASVGGIVGESVATTGASVGDAVGKRVGDAVAVHFLPL